MTSNSDQPTCLGEIYRRLERKHENYYGEVQGGYIDNIRVLAESFGTVEDTDKERGIIGVQSLCACKDSCGKTGFVKFTNGRFKDKITGKCEEVKLGETYTIGGYTKTDYFGRLIITDVSLISEEPQTKMQF